MPFKPGDRKPANSGRRKGQRNKRPSLRALQDAILDTGFDTAQEMVELYHNAEDEGIKLKILDLILRYTQPLPKPQTEAAAAELDGELDMSSFAHLTPAEFEAALEAAAEGPD